MDDDHSNCENMRKESDSQYPSELQWIPGVIRVPTVMITWVYNNKTKKRKSRNMSSVKLKTNQVDC